MTPRRSLRAATRAIYSTMRGRDLVFALAPEAGQGAPRKVDVVTADDHLAQEPPLPNPLPKGERGQAEREEGHQARTPDLMTRVRALYEDSAVPVREIARLCGVTERTLYRYVEKGGWKRRYLCQPRGEAAASANRGRRWQRAEGHEPVKGAGGRFVVRGAADEPIAHGIKATDPAGRARAAAACGAAAARHAKAKARADAAQAWDARRRAIDSISAAMAAYNRWRQSLAKEKAKTTGKGGFRDEGERAADARLEALYISHIEAAIACVKKLRE